MLIKVSFISTHFLINFILAGRLSIVENNKRLINYLQKTYSTLPYMDTDLNKWP